MNFLHQIASKSQGHSKRQRRGAVVVYLASILMLLLAITAFAVDIGYVLKIKTDMQRAADAAALAAAQRLAPLAGRKSRRVSRDFKCA